MARRPRGQWDSRVRGVTFRPRLIRSKEEFSIYLSRAAVDSARSTLARYRFQAIISATLQNDRAMPPRSPSPPPPLRVSLHRCTSRVRATDDASSKISVAVNVVNKRCYTLLSIYTFTYYLRCERC